MTAPALRQGAGQSLFLILIFDFVLLFWRGDQAVRIPGLKTGVSGSAYPSRQGAAFWTLPRSSARQGLQNC